MNRRQLLYIVLGTILFSALLSLYNAIMGKEHGIIYSTVAGMFFFALLSLFFIWKNKWKK